MTLMFNQSDQPTDLGIRAGAKVLSFPARPTVDSEPVEDHSVPQLAVSPELIEIAEGEETEPQFTYFTKLSDPKPRKRHHTIIGSPVDFADWTSDRSTDTPYGFGAEPLETSVKAKPSVAFRLQEQDLIVFSFLARYRFATADQLARLADRMPRSISKRLRRLEEQGFVHSQTITASQRIWLNRKAANDLIHSPFAPIHRSEVSFSTIAHTLGLVNIGVELEREAGGVDVLGERADYSTPATLKNRYKLGLRDSTLPKTLGEMTVTEREIAQAQMTGRANGQAKSFQQLSKAVRDAVANSTDAPELHDGNEHLFIVYGAKGIGASGVEHRPDLVVARDRTPEGKPQNIAIELELTKKTPQEWTDILRYYRDSGWMYEKVIYLTHKRSIAEALKKINDVVRLGEGGLSPQLLVRKYIPTSGNITPFWG
jgi:hypothetical protein